MAFETLLLLLDVAAELSVLGIDTGLLYGVQRLSGSLDLITLACLACFAADACYTTLSVVARVRAARQA